ncbi:MAG: hypothetical protein WCV82_02160 [Candidatus Paceibacterota bacterium]
MKTASTGRVAVLGLVGFITGVFLLRFVDIPHLPGDWQIFFQIGSPLIFGVIGLLSGYAWKLDVSPVDSTQPSQSQGSFNIWRIFLILSIVFIPITLLILFFSGINLGGSFNMRAYITFIVTAILVHTSLIVLFSYMARRYGR